MRTLWSILIVLVLPGCGSSKPAPPASAPAAPQSQTKTSAVGTAQAPAKTYFVYAKLQDTVMPVERGSKYEDPLNDALAKAQFGEVTGGGSGLTKDGKIEYIGVDIELVNLDSALELARKKLLECGAPKGSVLQYEKDGKSVELPIHPEK
jgi:hypothetical protein